MNKAEIVERVVLATEMPRREASLAVEAVCDAIIDSLKRGVEVDLRGFATFKTRKKLPYIRKNPFTGERVNMNARTIPVFIPSQRMKEALNDPKNLRGLEG
jgi:nucleoid DNA-binding protein